MEKVKREKRMVSVGKDLQVWSPVMNALSWIRPNALCRSCPAYIFLGFYLTDCLQNEVKSILCSPSLVENSKFAISPLVQLNFIHFETHSGME